LHESAEEMAGRLTDLAAEFKAAGRQHDATAALAGALAIYLDQFRGASGGAVKTAAAMPRENADA
jgi:hypothetical protein